MKLSIIAGVIFALSASVVLAQTNAPAPVTTPVTHVPLSSEDKQDIGGIDSACVQDAQTAGCGGEIVGKGLLKCLHAYKKVQRQTNKSFSFSSGCETALKKLHSDRKAGI